MVNHSLGARPQETVEHEKPSNVTVLDTLKPVCLAHITIPCSKALKIFSLAYSPSEWHTHTINVSLVSRLKILP